MSANWLSMWVKPRETIRRIALLNVRSGFLCFSWLYGFMLLLRLSQELSLGRSLSIGWIALTSAVLAIPVGMFMLSLFSLLLFGVGKILRGKGTYLEVRAAVSWSNVTLIGSLLAWIMMMLVFDQRLFFMEFYEQTFSGSEAVAVLVNLSLLILFGFWGVILFLHSLSEVQQFSFWMALLNMVLTGVCLILVGMGLSYITSMGTGP